MESSDQLWRLTGIGHPLWKHTHWREWVKAEVSMCIYFRRGLRFCYRRCIAVWTRNTEAFICHRCSLGECSKCAASVGPSRAGRGREVFFDLWGGLTAGGKWDRGDLLQFAVQLTQCYRNRHGPMESFRKDTSMFNRNGGSMPSFSKRL